MYRVGKRVYSDICEERMDRLVVPLLCVACSRSTFVLFYLDDEVIWPRRQPSNGSLLEKESNSIRGGTM